MHMVKLKTIVHYILLIITESKVVIYSNLVNFGHIDSSIPIHSILEPIVLKYYFYI